MEVAENNGCACDRENVNEMGRKMQGGVLVGGSANGQTLHYNKLVENGG